MLPSPCTWWFSNLSFGCQLLDPRCAKCSSRGLRPPSCTSQCWQLQVAGRHWGSPAVPVALLTSPCIPTSSSLVLGCVWKLCLVKGKGSQSVQFCPPKSWALPFREAAFAKSSPVFWEFLSASLEWLITQQRLTKNGLKRGKRSAKDFMLWFENSAGFSQ